jgi:hypothetical protein
MRQWLLIGLAGVLGGALWAGDDDRKSNDASAQKKPAEQRYLEQAREQTLKAIGKQRDDLQEQVNELKD